MLLCFSRGKFAGIHFFFFYFKRCYLFIQHFYSPLLHFNIGTLFDWSWVSGLTSSESPVVCRFASFLYIVYVFFCIFWLLCVVCIKKSFINNIFSYLSKKNCCNLYQLYHTTLIADQAVPCDPSMPMSFSSNGTSCL